MLSQTRFACLVLSLFVVIGCAVDEHDEVATPLMSLNLMSLNAMGTTALSGKGKVLASQPLGQNAMAAELAKDIYGMQISPGQEMLKYTSRCALGANDTLVIKDVNGVTQKWPGLLGMLSGTHGAKTNNDWTRGPLDKSGVRWWMACMLAHVNAFGVQVAVSLRADHPALSQLSQAEAQQFPYFEGAFYGDFGVVGDDSSVENMYACYGKDLYSACEQKHPGQGDAYAVHTLHQRVCAHGGCDNFYVVGPCLNYDRTGRYACSTLNGTSVTDCHIVSSSKPGQWNGATAYQEVVSSYLENIECVSQPD